MSLKNDKIILANAEKSALNVIKSLVRRHCVVTREGWLRQAIKLENIKIEWKFPFQKGGVGQSRLVSFSIYPKKD